MDVTAVRDELIGLDAAPYMTRLGTTETAINQKLATSIAQARARVQRELHLTLDTTVIKSNPDAGVQFDVEEEPYDYFTSDYRHFGWLKLRRRPVQSVERVRLMLGPQMTIFTYPREWIRVRHKQAHIQIVPTPGAAFQNLVMANGLYYLPYLSAAPIFNEYPQLIAVDYTAGIGDALASDEYADLALQIARLAAREVLLRLDNAVSPGVQSRSISEDGASESTSYARGQTKTLFGAHIDQIEADWERFKLMWQGHNTGPIFTVV